MVDLKAVISMGGELRPKLGKEAELGFSSEPSRTDNGLKNDFARALLALMGLRMMTGSNLPQQLKISEETSGLLPGEKLPRYLLSARAGDELNLLYPEIPERADSVFNPAVSEGFKGELVDYFLRSGSNREGRVFFFAEQLSGELKELKAKGERLSGNFEPLNNQRQVMPVKLTGISKFISERGFEHDLIDQVRDKMGFFFRGAADRMTIKLEPPSLGYLKLEIVLKENNHVTANITTDYQLVKEVLNNNLNLLKYALVRQGLCVDELNVFLNGNGASGQSSAREKNNSLSKGENDADSAGKVNRTLRQNRYIWFRNKDLALDIFI